EIKLTTPDIASDISGLYNHRLAGKRLRSWIVSIVLPSPFELDLITLTTIIPPSRSGGVAISQCVTYGPRSHIPTCVGASSTGAALGIRITGQLIVNRAHLHPTAGAVAGPSTVRLAAGGIAGRPTRLCHSGKRPSGFTRRGCGGARVGS